MEPLRAYVLAKLLLPNTDPHKHANEFINAFYGQAAPKMKDYLDLMQQQVRAWENLTPTSLTPQVCLPQGGVPDGGR